MSKWIRNKDGSIQSSKVNYKKNMYWSYIQKRWVRAEEEKPIKILKSAEAPKPITIHKNVSDQWYLSEEWKSCRSEFLKNYNRTHKKRICNICKLSEDFVVMNVDHILPVRRYWERRLDHSNLQILCERCNKHKGNWTEDNIEF